jgi:enterochelin esterase-like enzyme
MVMRQKLYKKLSLITLTLAFVCVCIVSGYTQPPRGPFFSSPQIYPDKTVAFRYHAPNAKSVKLSGQFLKGLADMEKDSLGIWSIKVGPITPDIYPYNFVVDGVSVMDPSNVAFFPNERFKASLVDIPGDTPLVHSLQNVPHGSVSYEYYPSVEGTTGSLVVYLPPGYDKNKNEKYPVFYLISGTTDTEETYFKVGRTNLILDNLIASGKAKPMIVVMPNGNVVARINEQKGGQKPGDPRGRDDQEARNRAKLFEDDLMQNIIPYIEKEYRTLTDKDSRAIGGFSRGGGQTLRAAFNNLDKFSYVCSYGSYLAQAEIEENFPHITSNPSNTNAKLKLLWVGVGNEDFLYDGAVKFMDYLKASNVKFTERVSGGGHTWMNVKAYVAESVPLLFK